MNWKDKYYEVKSEKDDLAKRCNELDNVARNLRTRCAQLESFKKKIINGGNFKFAATNAGRFCSSSEEYLIESPQHEHRRDYEDLFKSYESIQRDYRSVVKKHKCAVQLISKLKKEVQSLERRKGNSLKIRRKSNDSGVLHCEQRRADISTNNDNLENVLTQLQLRLGSAEKQLQLLSTIQHNSEEDCHPGKEDQSKSKEDASKKVSRCSLKFTILDHFVMLL